MASYNRDYMGGAAPPPGSRSQGFASAFRAYRVLIAINVLVFLVAKTAWGESFFLEHALVSLEALQAGRVWTLLLSGFFHLDLFHMVLTLGFVYVLGWRVEQEEGPGVLVLLYLVGSLGLGLASLAINPAPGISFGERGTPISTGSAFFVAPGLVVTNAHVVGNAESLEVELEGEAGPLKARVRARDEGLDLALVEVPTSRPVLPMAPHRPLLGQVVFAYGYGSLQGETQTQLMTSGRVSGFQTQKQWLVFNGVVNPGNSGGALVDGAGRWVGVVVAKRQSAPGEDPLGLAVEASAVKIWLAAQGVTPETSESEPQGEAPPTAPLGRSVVRLVVRGQLPSGIGSATARKLDPWLFGASGAFMALAGFLCLGDPRREVFVLGSPVPLLVIVGFGAVADCSGALRRYTNPYSWAHLYHLAGAALGMAGLKLYEGKLKALLEAAREKRRRAQFVIHRGGGAEPTSGPAPGRDESKLSLADRARLDRVLEKVSRSGLDSLSAEERAFLDEASGKLRGE